MSLATIYFLDLFKLGAVLGKQTVARGTVGKRREGTACEQSGQLGRRTASGHRRKEKLLGSGKPCVDTTCGKKSVGGKPCADTMAARIESGSASAGSQIGSQESGLQVRITGHARAYQALEVVAGTPKRVKRDGSVTPPEEERAKFYVGVVDVNRCNWVLVATNTLETLEKCDEVPTELLPVTGELREAE